jgi:endonuclease/exonuclease/phosphatase family metal-dependent hydrolase
MTTAMLRIVSYNLKDYGKSTQDTQRAQHRLLADLAPDVLCLQEIWDDTDDLTPLHRHFGAIADALGMTGEPVPARRSHCHMAILWRPELTRLSWRIHELNLWHGPGIAVLGIGAAVPLRVAVTHMPPWDPQQRLSDTRTVAALLAHPDHATVIAGDWNSLGVDPGYDPEPDWTLLRPDKIWRHVRWNEDPDAQQVADRRPAQLLRRSRMWDAAPHLGTPWQPTGGHADGDLPRRPDAFWTTRPQALRGYHVIDTPAARPLSDHLPIQVDLDPSALDASPVPAAAETAVVAGN